MTAEELAALVERVALKACCPCAWAEDLPDHIEKCTEPCSSCTREATAAVSLIRAEVLEEAAKECAYHWTSKECAAAIRALKEKQ